MQLSIGRIFRYRLFYLGRGERRAILRIVITKERHGNDHRGIYHRKIKRRLSEAKEKKGDPWIRGSGEREIAWSYVKKSINYYNVLRDTDRPWDIDTVDDKSWNT